MCCAQGPYWRPCWRWQLRSPVRSSRVLPGGLAPPTRLAPRSIIPSQACREQHDALQRQINGGLLWIRIFAKVALIRRLCVVVALVGRSQR